MRSKWTQNPVWWAGQGVIVMIDTVCSSGPVNDQFLGVEGVEW